MTIVAQTDARLAAVRADLDDLVADGVAVAPTLFDRLDWLVAMEDAGRVVDVTTGAVIDPVLPVEKVGS